uniref:Uncharacterized protein n=1 Tax=Cacopsylla melanoneura TaxID=428564 RepID=A0A8D9ATC3_9HEMI
MRRLFLISIRRLKWLMKSAPMMGPWTSATTKGQTHFLKFKSTSKVLVPYVLMTEPLAANSCLSEGLSLSCLPGGTTQMSAPESIKKRYPREWSVRNRRFC